MGYHSFLERHWIIFYCVILTVPFSFFKNISDFTFIAFISQTSLWLVVIIICIRCIYVHTPPPSSEILHTFPYDTFRFYSSLGGVSFLFVCHDLSFSVFNEFRNATRVRWRGLVLAAMILSEISFLGAGVSGFLMYYNEVEDNIVDNFPTSDVFAIILRILLTINIVVTSPYSLYMPR